MIPERRRFARLYVGVEATYYRPLEPTAKVSVLVQDISGAGVRFIAKEVFPAGTKLHIDIALPGAKETLSLDGEVVWQYSFSRSFYDTGMTFDSVSAELQQKLERFFRNQQGRGEEQRRFLRHSLSTLITYSVLPHTDSHSCLSLDISLSGMRALMREILPVRTLMKISLHLPSDIQPIEAQCTVVWTRKGAHELFETGIEFTAIADADMDRVNEYIKQSLHISS